MQQRQQLLTSPFYLPLSGSNASGVALLASVISEFRMDSRVKYLAPHATAKVLSSRAKGVFRNGDNMHVRACLKGRTALP